MYLVYVWVWAGLVLMCRWFRLSVFGRKGFAFACMCVFDDHCFIPSTNTMGFDFVAFNFHPSPPNLATISFFSAEMAARCIDFFSRLLCAHLCDRCCNSCVTHAGSGVVASSRCCGMIWIGWVGVLTFMFQFVLLFFPFFCWFR